MGALERARRHGAPLADTLAAQARDAALALAARVQEDAARAGPKIQLVVALLLVPSVLLLVAAALAVGAARIRRHAALSGAPLGPAPGIARLARSAGCSCLQVAFRARTIAPRWPE